MYNTYVHIVNVAMSHGCVPCTCMQMHCRKAHRSLAVTTSVSIPRSCWIQIPTQSPFRKLFAQRCGSPFRWNILQQMRRWSAWWWFWSPHRPWNVWHGELSWHDFWRPNLCDGNGPNRRAQSWDNFRQPCRWHHSGRWRHTRWFWPRSSSRRCGSCSCRLLCVPIEDDAGLNLHMCMIVYTRICMHMHNISWR